MHEVLKALIHYTLFHLKCMKKWSDKSVSCLLKFLKEVLPVREKLPSSYYKAKRLVRDLGLDYHKIHACPNDCKLYWKEYEHDIKCHVCGSPRYKRGENEFEEELNSFQGYKGCLCHQKQHRSCNGIRIIVQGMAT